MDRRKFITALGIGAAAALPDVSIASASNLPDTSTAWCASCGRKLVSRDGKWRHEELAVKTELGTSILGWTTGRIWGHEPKRKARRFALRHSKPPEFSTLPESDLCEGADILVNAHG